MRKFAIFLMALIMLIPNTIASAVSVDSYSDVNENDWYYNAIQYVTESGLFSGTTETTFAPDDTMTRAMAVTVLGRFAKVEAAYYGDIGIITSPAVNVRREPSIDSEQIAVVIDGQRVQIMGMTGDWYHIRYGDYTGYVRNDLMKPINYQYFTDVTDDKYYAPYVNWAFNQEIVNGTSYTTFSPYRYVSRQEICVILYKYAQSINANLKPVQEKFDFKDDSSISSWAKDAVYTMQQAGIIAGKYQYFNPHNEATRSEMAVIFTRFAEVVGQKADSDYTPEPSPAFAADGSYIYGTALPETTSVVDSYFDDAAFIGHSYVAGMEMYFSLPNAVYFGITGISTPGMLKYEGFELEHGNAGLASADVYEFSDYTVSDYAVSDYEMSADDSDLDFVSTYAEDSNDGSPEDINDGNGDDGTTDDEYPDDGIGSPESPRGTLANALSMKSYGKIYVMLGTNDLGVSETSTSDYMTNMLNLVNLIQEKQPNATIYLLAIAPVSRTLSESSDVINRNNIIAYNSVLKQISSDMKVVYLDTFSLFADTSGHFPETVCASDGIHPLSSQYVVLKNFLKNHTLQPAQ